MKSGLLSVTKRLLLRETCSSGVLKPLFTAALRKQSTFVASSQPKIQLGTCLNNIETYNSKINAFSSVTDRATLLHIESQKKAEVSAESPLEGLPIAVKANFCTKDFPTTCGSNMLKDFTSPYDASVVQYIKDSGGIIIGKTNMDEFGMGSANTFSAHGITYNPATLKLGGNSSLVDLDEDLLRVAGGSSGGSAAAVAADMCFAALGSDTGGSVRLPASYCGVVGFKPSYGRCSRYGLISYANSLDTVGILAKSVDSVEKVYDVISRYDARDPTAIPTEIRTQIDEDRAKLDLFNSPGLEGLRVGVPEEYYVEELTQPSLDTWKRSIEFLRSEGATIVPVSCPYTPYALSAYYILAPAEASSNLARYDGVRYGHRDCENVPKAGELYSKTRDEGFGPEVQRRILLGTYVLTANAYDQYFLQAQKIRRLIQEDFNQVFALPNRLSPTSASTKKHTNADVHVLITPAAISTAPLVKDYQATKNPVDAYVNDVMTIPPSLAGIPAITVPFGISDVDGHPIGVQLLSQYGDEKTLLKVAAHLEAGKQA
ncbi:Glutamyl-tRNA amidotransferase A subunit [Basidiobolus meristosporus CBS 931.73]|uniref:Glutamyl-tRNA(Gln) amidotransferase subunit A, mitochondrial n=1 Tax=Basidiobolus meristosporus CBS 931.73 TaxID=1314790 RepID=A0A1Y1Z9X9_9FUNG|nr:Glutamyl-tRNA amidotransferase A subunit [Basidiobolus meristosporus CBS 931.73]|eukprot:ORY06837.1 Glutamyl-tRNA amidotransferase A subunit [Basidiobolus meristosporus CBS 931.73]